MLNMDASRKPPSRAKFPGVYPSIRSSKKVRSDYIINSVRNAFDILEQFHENVSELSIAELSSRLGLSKNSIFRLLATLESRNYIEQNECRARYRLGYMNLQLGYSAVRTLTVQQQSKPIMQSLTELCGETSNIAILREGQIIYLDAVETHYPLRAIPRISTPIYCTAIGKVLISGVREKHPLDRDHIMELKRYTSNTITDRQMFNSHLTEVAAHGYAIEDEELDLGLRGVAAPVRNHNGFVVAAVGVSGPSIRFDKSRMYNELVPMVMKAAKEISGRLGYQS